MTISELIRALENVKFRNPNAPVVVHEIVDGRAMVSPVKFGDMDERGILINPHFDPLENYNQDKPLHTLVLYGQHATEVMGY